MNNKNKKNNNKKSLKENLLTNYKKEMIIPFGVD